MKILIVAPRYHTNLYYRIKALQKEGHEVFLFVLYKQNSEKYDILEPISIRRSKLNNFLDKFHKKSKNDFWKTKINFPIRKDFKEKISSIKPDVVIVKNLQTVLSLTALWYARKFTNKIFILIQTDKYYVNNRLKKFLIYILKNFFKVKAIITPLKNKLNKQDPFFKYVPFIFEIEDFEKKYFKNDRINILDIGKFYKRKDHLLLLEVINNLKNKYNIKLTIVGEKGEEEIREEINEYIKKNDLNKIVEIRENIPYDESLAIFRNQDLFILPSYDEPAAYSIVEAMANKLAVIVSDTCGTKCYIKEGYNGSIFRTKDVNDLEQKVEKMIKNKNKLIEMGKNSFRTASSEHSFQFYIKRVKSIIYE